MDERELEKQYKELFPDNEVKAKAFDEIARQFYFCNFGTMQKSDVETLLFSLYLDKILEKSESDIQSYSDYRLSKYLGITQNRISTLKERKELKYPYRKFDWKRSFERISKNARYENGKIKIYIPDRNLYLEIKNAIENAGGYIDVQLNSKLLKMFPEYFIDLILEISDDADREKIKEKIKCEIKKMKGDTDFLKEESIDARLEEASSIGDFLRKNGKDIAINVLIEAFPSCIPVVGSTVGGILKNILQVIKNNMK